MPSRLYDLLGTLGMNSQKMTQRRKLIDYAWQNCENKSPMKLDKLLTLGGVFTGLRILAIVSVFGYDVATKLYPVLAEETIDSIDRDLMTDYEGELKDLEFPEEIETQDYPDESGGMRKIQTKDDTEDELLTEEDLM